MLQAPLASWQHVGSITVDDFLLNDHKKLFAAISQLRARNGNADMGSLYAELGDKFPADVVGGLFDGVQRTDVPTYVREVRRSSRDRRLAHLFDKAQNQDKWPALPPQIKAAIEEPLDVKANHLIVIRGDSVSEKPLRWMWRHYLPLGKLVHFGGNSSQAKSPVTIDLIARVSVGASWPDGTANAQGPGSAILLNIEDDFEYTIMPRYRLAGGDKSKLYYVKGTRILGESERLVTLESDMEEISKLARSLPDLSLIVIDPVTNYLGTKKFIDEADIRSILTPLANLAAELRIVIITVGHFNRREAGTDPMHRFLGAAAFIGVARAVYAFGPDPEEESKFAHVITAVRGCGGEGSALRYHTELATDHCPDSEPNEIIRVVWDGTSDATAEDSVDPVSTKDKSQEEEAAQMLKDFLKDGKKPSADCTAFLKAEGYDLDKLNGGRIRRKAGADSKKFSGDKFYSWYLVTAALSERYSSELKTSSIRLGISGK